MAWVVRLEKNAEREFSKLPADAQRLIRNYLYMRVQRSEDPKALGKPLRGKLAGLWRYRVDKYRLICQFQNEILVILVLRIGKRDSIYD